MAETILGVLISKLGEAMLSEAGTYCASLLCTEYSAFRDLFDEIHKAVDLLAEMEAYIKDLKNNNSKTSDVFNKKIKKLAFRIEDVVDEFKYKIEDHKNGGFASKIKKRIQHVKVWHRLAIELRNINADLNEAAKLKDIFARRGGGNDHHDESTKPTLCFAREEDLVGIDDNAKKLKEWLMDSLEERRSRIITICGMGGTGKTTLVHHVYKILKGDFDVAVWLTVSKSYQIKDLLKKFARDCGIFVDANMEVPWLVEAIRNNLEGKRCFLVVDDVWEIDVWRNILDAFPSNCISRFVLTSRTLDVASLATDNCAIMLEPLEDHLSWELFCNVVFWNSIDRRCPPQLQDLATKFLQQCEGLPLAIACLGRLLSCKPLTYSSWKNVYDDLELQWTKHVKPGVHSILKVSLDDLSYELKNCFLHCALFPEDYEIKRRRLIRYWITSGFIKEEKKKTLEEVSDGYLNDLVNRSLLQVTWKNAFGRVKCCRMHDSICHIALDETEEECFGKIYEGSEFSTDGLRRLLVQSDNILPITHLDTTRLRAIYAFTRNLDVDLLRPILACSRLLSVLDLRGTEIKVLPSEVFNMFNLRLFTGIKILPEELKRLQNLEVLDALGTGLVSLPKGVAILKKLRYIYAGTMATGQGYPLYDGVATGQGYPLYGGVKVPRGIGNLTRLHTLQDVKASLETLNGVAALTELRSFAVTDVRSRHSTLCTTIMNMSHLVHLRISALDENEILPLEALHLPETLSKLGLAGQIEKKWILQMISSWSNLCYLSCLYLKWCKFDDHSFSGLLMLHSLCKLDMTKAYDGKEMCFPIHSFPKLRELYIRGAPHLNQIEIKEGALEILGILVIYDCPELKYLPRGIEYLTALKVLAGHLRGTHREA